VSIPGDEDEQKPEKIAKLPIWVFHGSKDGTVNPSRSDNMVSSFLRPRGIHR
jgi:predicted peptidase